MRAALGLLQDVVVGVAFLPDLRRHAVEALRAAFRSRQRHIGDRTRDASVAVVKGMKGHKPQVRERGFHHRVPVRAALNHLRNVFVSRGSRAAAGASK